MFVVEIMSSYCYIAMCNSINLFSFVCIADSFVLNKRQLMLVFIWL